MLYPIESTTLYYLGANNCIYEWEISISDNVIKITHGQRKGAKTETFEHIEKGKGGRSIYGQLQSRVNSRINKQKLKGYKETILEASEGRTNALDLPKPMLAQQWNKIKNLNIEECFVQYKYDGNRCLIIRRGKEILAYSRQGKLITSINHILGQMDIPEDIVIDGELYAHGIPLPTIRSWISRQQANTEQLCFHAYDVVLPLEYSYRLKALHSFNLGKAARVVPTWHWSAIDIPLSELLMAARKEEYEGLILRAPNTGYEIGKRSKSLIKVKQFLDQEFIVEKLYRSEKGRPMAMCQTNMGKRFDVVLPGNMKQKENQLIDHEHYIGKKLTVEFSQWTPDGLPFHAVAKCWYDE